MKKNILNGIFFLVPLIITIFNLQVFVARFISPSIAQLIAYSNIGLLLTGILLNINHPGEYSRTARLWIIYYIIYFSFATLASALYGTEANILFSSIPFIYVLAFYIYLKNEDNRLIFKNVILYSFVTSSLLAIYLYNINFDLDRNGIYIYKLDRAEGVFGDANNTALVAILAFILVYKNNFPKKKYYKLLKIILAGFMFYTITLTFSTTGFIVFLISIILLNHNFFKGLKLTAALSILPIVYLVLINIDKLTSGINLVGQQRDKINNVVNLLSFNTDKVNDSGRSDLLLNLLEHVYQHPIIGNGIDFAISLHGHNTIVGVWADAGIFTLIFFLFMLSIYFKRTLNLSRELSFFILSLLLTMCIFMLSLQTVINQPYLIALFIYIGYIIDYPINTQSFPSTEKLKNQ
ncbi:hypothetical protein [Formosa sp. A9]|uniref:hypothetical protein n=1 Tax=Formosa sp. A9 TaxID=3442641 RepID=UPI003EBB5385